MSCTCAFEAPQLALLWWRQLLARIAIALCALGLASCGTGSDVEQFTAAESQDDGSAPQGPFGEQVLLWDDFEKDELDQAVWSYESPSIVVAGGALLLRKVETDITPRLRARPLKVKTDRPILIERRFRVRWGYGVPFPGNHPPFRGGMELHLASEISSTNASRGVNYAHNVSFINGECISTDFLLGGRNSAFFVWGSQAARFCVHEDPSRAFSLRARWGEWVHEVLVFDPRTGRLTWSIDGSPAATIDSEPLTNTADQLAIELHADGWYWGHEHDTDWIRVTQSALEDVDDERLYCPMTGLVTELTEDQGGYEGHAGTDVATEQESEKVAHRHRAEIDWWNLDAFSLDHPRWPGQEMWPGSAEGVAYSGRPIYAAAAGIARVIESESGGRMVVITHADQSQTRYLHAYVVLIPDMPEGFPVDPMTPIAIEGNTGIVGGATGLHLHFELVDPNQVSKTSPWPVNSKVTTGERIEHPEWRILVR